MIAPVAGKRSIRITQRSIVRAAKQRNASSIKSCKVQSLATCPRVLTASLLLRTAPMLCGTRIAIVKRTKPPENVAALGALVVTHEIDRKVPQERYNHESSRIRNNTSLVRV
jgi:hypothetical protein